MFKVSIKKSKKRLVVSIKLDLHQLTLIVIAVFGFFK